MVVWERKGLVWRKEREREERERAWWQRGCRRGVKR